MRIAYIAPYQGNELRRRRPTLGNLALAGNLKIELVAEMLTGKGHDVEILSQGEVDERSLSYYPAFEEAPRFHPAVPVHYCSAFPVRRVQGAWSVARLVSLLRRQHRERPFDVALVYNFKEPQSLTALYAARVFKIPVVLEYEDDAFVDVLGRSARGVRATFDRRLIRAVFRSISGCIGVSPYLLSQVPSTVPQLLLRGVIGRHIIDLADDPSIERQDWVVFSGTHSLAKGLVPLLEAWRLCRPPGWQLHIAGHGGLTSQLKAAATGDSSIVFHGLLNREQNAQLLRQARIGMNPHDVSNQPGIVFAFKIIEYLAAGIHVVTTPMGEMERDLERGVTYITDNRAQTIAESLMRIIQEQAYKRTAVEAAHRAYSAEFVSAALDDLLCRVTGRDRGHLPKQPRS